MEMDMSSTQEKIITRIYQVGFLLFPIVGVTVKDAGSAIFTILALVGLIYGWKGWGNLDTQEKTIFIGFIIFVTTTAISLIATDDWHTAAHRIDRLLRFLLAIPVYLVIKRFGIGILKSYSAGIVFSGFVLGLVAVYKIFVLKTGSTEGPYNSAFIANYAVIVSVFIVTVLVSGKPDIFTRIILSASFIASLVAMVLSESRTSWVALIAVVGLALLLEFQKNRKLLIGSLILVLISVIGIYHYPPVNARIGQAVTDIENYNKDPGKASSVNDRLNIWRNMVILFKSSPLIGAGLGDYGYESKRLINEGKSLTVHIHNSAHSIYFESLGMNGLLGLVGLILGLFVLPIKSFNQIRRSENNETAIIFSRFGILVLCTLALLGLSGTWYAFNAIVNLYIFSMLACLASSREIGENPVNIFKFGIKRTRTLVQG